MKKEDIYPLFELDKLQKMYGDNFRIIKNAWKNNTIAETIEKIHKNPSENQFAANTTSEQIDGTVARFNALLNWNKYKQIYDFSDEMFEIITDAETFTFYSAVFDNLPFLCFCINHEFGRFKCVIVEKSAESLSLTYIGNTISYINIPFHMAENRKIDELICEQSSSAVPDFYVKNVIKTLNAIMYICSENADIYTVSEPIPQTASRKNKKRSQVINRNKVGMNVAHIIRENRKRYESASESGHSHGKKAPHMRKAHYHHYWTGSKTNKKLIVKFISSVFVNSGENEETPETTTRR